MNDIFRDIFGIASAIVGVAILTVLVSKQNQTDAVIKAASGGFAQALSTAMTGSYNGAGAMTGSLSGL